jgi:hypothetical protein
MPWGVIPGSEVTPWGLVSGPEVTPWGVIPGSEVTPWGLAIRARGAWCEWTWSRRSRRIIPEAGTTAPWGIVARAKAARIA